MLQEKIKTDFHYHVVRSLIMFNNISLTCNILSKERRKNTKIKQMLIHFTLLLKTTSKETFHSWKEQSFNYNAWRYPFSFILSRMVICCLGFQQGLWGKMTTMKCSISRPSDHPENQQPWRHGGGSTYFGHFRHVARERSAKHQMVTRFIECPIFDSKWMAQNPAGQKQLLEF